jgi:flagellar basal-body rod protein FlgC
MIRALDTSTSALVAQRVRMDVIAGNVANAESTHQEDGVMVPYRRRYLTLAEGDGQGGPGVHVQDVRQDTAPFQLEYKPGDPSADANGYVRLPNVNITTEYIDMMMASRAYEVNAAMLSMSRNMVQQAIRLFA